MERASVDDVEGWSGPADVKRPLGRALGMEEPALNYYELAPGESFAFGYFEARVLPFSDRGLIRM
jgi:hypothetical protein